MWAPGFTHSPNKMGSVAMVTVMMTSAPATASCTDEQTRTSPCTVLANFSAFSLVRFHILTLEWVTKGTHWCISLLRMPHQLTLLWGGDKGVFKDWTFDQEHSINLNRYLLRQMKMTSPLKRVGTSQSWARTQPWWLNDYKEGSRAMQFGTNSSFMLSLRWFPLPFSLSFHICEMEMLTGQRQCGT